MFSKNSCKKIERFILKYVNISRRKNGLSILQKDMGLVYLSRRHSSKMAKRSQIWHGNNVHLAHDKVASTIPRILKTLLLPLAIMFPPLWLFLFFGDKGASGENVAMMPKGIVKNIGKVITNKDIARALHKSWMNSPDHRRNILNSNFRKIGIGVKRKGNRFYATEVFYG